jgi:hypothetical protein
MSEEGQFEYVALNFSNFQDTAEAESISARCGTIGLECINIFNRDLKWHYPIVICLLRAERFWRLVL